MPHFCAINALDAPDSYQYGSDLPTDSRVRENGRMNQRSRACALSHRMHRRLKIMAALVVLVVVGVPGVAYGATSNAVGKAATQTSSPRPAVALPSCPDATFCTFQNVDYKGTRWNFSYNSRPHNTWFWIGAGANDKISSLYNHRAWATWVAKDCPADQYHSYWSGGQSWPNLTDLEWLNGAPTNDSYSALALATNNGGPPPSPKHGSC
jgi:hypothetical protein